MEHIVELVRGHGFDEIVGDPRLHAADHPRVLRRGSQLGVEHRLLGRGDPARTAGERQAARASYLDETSLVISGDARATSTSARSSTPTARSGAAVDDRRSSGSRPARVRLVDNRRGRAGRAVPREAGRGEVFSDTINTGIYALEPEVLRQIRQMSPTTARRSSSPAARVGAPALRVRRSTATGRTSATRPVPGGKPRRARREGLPYSRECCD